MNKFILVFALLTSFGLQAQRTIGLLSYKPWLSYDGFNMIYPHNQPNVYLLNNCGEIVHVWEGEEGQRPGNTAYLREDGTLIKTSRSANIMSDPIWAGGGGEKIEIRDWNNNLIKEYSLNTDTERLHHDIAPMKNGNVLAIVWELKTKEEAIEAGRDLSLLKDDELWPDKIIEWNPETNEIVWEWHAWDHLIQDYDETKANYGVVADHPEKININYDTSDGAADWFHTNAIDYDPINDQILLSVPTFDEMWVIDHTTTTEEAASGSGGFNGMGGDLLYRWGNPAAYNQGTENDKKLFYQHDVQFVDNFLSEAHPLYGKFAAFNNRIGDDYSSVVVWDNPYDMYEASFEKIGSVFAPDDYKINRTHPIPQNMFSTGLSSVQVLPNNNLLICDGRHGYSFEITQDDDIVWEYKTPLKNGASATQGDTLEINNNLTFRMTRYPLNYPAFEGRDLSFKGFLELGSDEEFCNNILPIEMTYNNDLLKIYPNPSNQFITIEWESKMHETLQIIDLYGNTIRTFDATGARVFQDVSDLAPGHYFVRTSRGGMKRFSVVK